MDGLALALCTDELLSTSGVYVHFWPEGRRAFIDNAYQGL